MNFILIVYVLRRRLEKIVKSYTSSFLRLQNFFIKMTSANCPNCEKLMDCLANLEAHMNIMQNSFKLLNYIINQFKKESVSCSTRIIYTRDPEISTERVLRKNYVKLSNSSF